MPLAIVGMNRVLVTRVAWSVDLDRHCQAVQPCRHVAHACESQCDLEECSRVYSWEGHPADCFREVIRAYVLLQALRMYPYGSGSTM